MSLSATVTDTRIDVRVSGATDFLARFNLTKNGWRIKAGRPTIFYKLAGQDFPTTDAAIRAAMEATR